MTQITVMSGPERRRRWSDEDRRRILTEAFAPGAKPTRVAQDHDVATGLLYEWRKQALHGYKPAAAFSAAIVVEEPQAPPPISAPLAVPSATAGGLGVGRVPFLLHAEPAQASACEEERFANAMACTRLSLYRVDTVPSQASQGHLSPGLSSTSCGDQGMTANSCAALQSAQLRLQCTVAIAVTIGLSSDDGYALRISFHHQPRRYPWLL
jgi:transposase